MKAPENYVILTLPASLTFLINVVFGWQRKESGHQLLIKVSLNHESVMKDNMFDSTCSCYRTRSTSVCHKRLSGENIKAKKLKQHSATNNSDTANKSRDVFFKEDVKKETSV